MTSDCAGDQVSQEPDGLTSVKATGAIGGRDRPNEAPLLYSQRCGIVRLVEEWLPHNATRSMNVSVNVITALDSMGLINRSAARDKLRDGQPG